MILKSGQVRFGQQWSKMKNKAAGQDEIVVTTSEYLGIKLPE